MLNPSNTNKNVPQHSSLNGMTSTHFSDGSISTSTSWYNGKKHGVYQSWFDSGHRKEISMWVMGKQLGDKELWDGEYTKSEYDKETTWVETKHSRE